MARVDLVAARTTETDADRAADDLARALDADAVPPKLLVFFASRDRDHVALNDALRRRMPGTRLVGASCARQIDAAGQHTGSIVASALRGDVDVGLGAACRIGVEPVRAGTDAMLAACRDLGVAPEDLSKRHVGMVITDGYGGRKEELLLGAMEPNSALILVGGGACDESLTDPSSIIHVDDRVLADAAAIVIFQTDARWAALRSHWYRPTGRRVTITKIDAACLRALEIDGKPAAQRYADLLGVEPAELTFGTPRGFARSPTGILVGREYFLRSPHMPLADGSILFANLLEEGMELELMEADDLAGSTRRFLAEEVPARVGEPTAGLFFSCAGRRWFTDAVGQTGAVSRTFGSAPWAIGMESWYEIYCGFTLNATLSALVFGAG